MASSALRAEAIRESLPDFYAQAVVDTELDPIASPEIDITAGEEGGARQLRRRCAGASDSFPSPVTKVCKSRCPV